MYPDFASIRQDFSWWSTYFNFWWVQEFWAPNLGLNSHISIVIFDAEQVYLSLDATNFNVKGSYNKPKTPNPKNLLLKPLNPEP